MTIISNLIEKDWELENILRKGETLLINGPSNIQYELSTTLLSSQIALSLSLGRDIILLKNKYKKKVLFINTYFDNKELFNLTSTQIGGESNFSIYSENFTMMSIPSENFILLIDQLKKIVKNSNADIIVWDNINRLVSQEMTLIKVILLIKEISGLKTKIISHYFNPNKNQYEIFTLSQEASAFVSLSHIGSTEKYILKIDRKNGNYISIAECYKNDKRLSFYNNNVKLYHTSDNINYIEHDDGITPPLPL